MKFKADLPCFVRKVTKSQEVDRNYITASATKQHITKCFRFLNVADITYGVTDRIILHFWHF